jgi:hypothetical protein
MFSYLRKGFVPLAVVLAGLLAGLCPDPAGGQPSLPPPSGDGQTPALGTDLRLGLAGLLPALAPPTRPPGAQRTNYRFIKPISHTEKEARLKSINDFPAAKEGPHIAAVKGDGRTRLTLQVTGPGLSLKPQAGAGVLKVPFNAKRGQHYTITVEAERAGPVKTELAVLYVTEAKSNKTSKRALNPARPFDPPALRAGRKDPLIPILVQLADRHLAGVTNKNELDQVFEKALSRRPQVKPMLAQFVRTYRGLPPNVRSEHFVAPTGSERDPITRADVEKAWRDFGELIRKPRLIRIDPFTPGNVHTPGQALTLVGNGFSTKDPKENSVILTWLGPPQPGKPPVFGFNPPGPTVTELKFSLPASGAITPGPWLVYVGVTGRGTTNPLVLTVGAPPAPPAPEPPVITDMSPGKQQPGQGTLIKGSNFKPDTTNKKSNRIRMNALDVFLPQQEVDATYLANDQLKFDIPATVVPGQYAVQVVNANGVSAVKTYEVGVPQYKIVFTKMECLDESDPEWWGHDEIVTFWAVCADGTAVAKNTGEYEGFDDGTTKLYTEKTSDDKAGDGNVWMPDGTWGEVRYGLGLSTQLYEWDAGDVKAAQDFAKFAGEVFSDMISIFWSKAAGDIAQKITKYLGDVVKWVASLFGGDPDDLGLREEYFSAVDLQKMLGPGKKVDRTLEFRNDDWTGSYRLYYSIWRK